MTSEEISEQLQKIAKADNFVEEAYKLTEVWTSAGVDLEVVEPVLRFMEEHSSIDFGSPGPLTHFIEQFYGKGYEEKLLESVRRRPTNENVWMLNRLINGTKVADQKQIYISELKQARSHPLIEEHVVCFVNELLVGRY